MPAPVLTFTGQRIYEATYGIAQGFYPDVSESMSAEEALDYPLAHWSDALAAPLNEVAELTRDQEDGTRGWAVLFDPYRCPTSLLPWLAQWEGVEVPEGLGEDETRALIDEAPGQDRGTPWSIEATARAYLTGTKTVYMQERYGGNAGILWVRTLTTETPDPDLVLSQLKRRQKPGGIVLDYATVTGASYDALDGAYTTYTAMDAAFTDYIDQQAG